MKYSDISRSLCRKLIDLCPDEEYVCGILGELGTDNNMMKMLTFIEHTPDISPEEVCLYALEITNAPK